MRLYEMFSNTITIIMQEMGVVIGYPVLRVEFIKKKLNEKIMIKQRQGYKRGILRLLCSTLIVLICYD